MPVIWCTGWRCQRMISITEIPGGSHAALAEPESFATSFVSCSDCTRPFCDRCFTPRRGLHHPTCRSCGGRLRPGPAEAPPRPDRRRDEAFSQLDLGLELGSQGQDVNALLAFDKAISLRPGFIDAHLRRGELLTRLGRLEEAVMTFEHVTRLDGPKALAFFQLAATLMQAAGRTEEAIDAYGRSVEIDPTFVKAMVQRANALLRIDRYQEAIVVSDAAITVEPTNAEAHFLLGTSRLLLGHLEASVAAFREVLRLQPDHPFARDQLAIALDHLDRGQQTCGGGEDHGGEAEAHREAALHRDRGIGLARAGDHGAALDAFDEAARGSPGDVLTHSCRGATLRKLGRFDEAVEAFALVTRLDSPKAFAFFELAESLASAGRPEEALAAYDQAIEADPRDVQPLNGKAHTLGRNGRPEEALRVLDQVFALEPTNAYATKIQGVALVQLGRHNEAISAMDRALQVRPDDASSYFVLAGALAGVGRTEEASAAQARYEELLRRQRST